MRTLLAKRVLVCGIIGFVAPHFGNPIYAPAAFAQSENSACNIKGNISIKTGERIYHVPGQEYYNDTVIRPKYGERWFCSEVDARAAGWRRSKR